MASLVAICNLALSHLGVRDSIAALDEGSTEARICNANLSDVRDTLLGDFNWNFARRVETLALRAETAPTGWTYAYSVPNKCIRFRGIWLGPAPLNVPPPRWELASIADVNGNDVSAILTNTASAEGLYTRQIENPELFSRGFTLALAWRLAEAVALPLTNKESIYERTAKLALVKVNEGAVMDANEGVTVTYDRDPDWIRARGSSTASSDLTDT